MALKGKVNILIVDDRPENLVAMEAILDNDDYHLLKASSGEEALKYLLKENIALILLDVHMPGMDGFSTAKMIRAREKTKHIPILFITANNMESEHIFLGYSVGAVDYILKPIDPLILKAKVERFVEMHRMKQQLLRQNDALEKNKRELEEINRHLQETTDKLQISESLANVISETSTDAMLVLDERGQILKANLAARNHLNCTSEEILTRNIIDFFQEKTARNFIKRLIDGWIPAQHFTGIEKENELTITRSDGTEFLANVQIGVKIIQNTTIIATTIRDITEKKKHEALIEHMAYHDFLTSLPNRRAFYDRLNKEIKKGKENNYPVSVLFLDMDRFKNINDSLGHSVGDDVLKVVSERLRSILPGSGFLARIGGDEFTIILPKISREDALETAERILDAFNEPVVIQPYELYVTTSIGLSTFPYDGEVGEELVKHADVALYQAKEQGKNKYRVFHTGMNIQSYRSFIMQNDLRKAIVRDELEIYYQPRMSSATGKITSAEALLRWNHPDWGIVSPGEFIPLAEQTGQIDLIGEWVFAQVVRQITDWKKQGFDPVRIAVNFSARQFLQKDLLENLQGVIKRYGVAPEQIEIEITESTFLESKDFISHTLQKLRDLGISISIDDFGTGYASLNYLSRLPIDILKIDKTFIDDIVSPRSTNRIITSMIIQLAKTLDLKVIGEGVETEAQFDYLASEGCDEVQGYLLSHPLNKTEFEALLQEGKVLPEKIEHQEQVDTRTIDIEIKNEMVGLKAEYGLTTREIEVFELIANGLSNKEISEKLYISPHTVKNHITKIFQKMDVADRAQAMAVVYDRMMKK